MASNDGTWYRKCLITNVSQASRSRMLTGGLCAEENQPSKCLKLKSTNNKKETKSTTLECSPTEG